MEQKRLNLYTINMKYVRNLHNQGDEHVFSVSPQSGKANRPFVGIIIICDSKQYCIPLSSPKEKHKTMKNSIDFHRIIDNSGKLIGVLDFNNMIPVRNDLIEEVDIKIRPNDTPAIKYYKNLVIDQLRFCRQNHEIITNKANKLYRMVMSDNSNRSLKSRCLKWNKLEEVLEKFPVST